MGFLKKITRPISKALDKIVPNEVKPFLPYLAAVAPYMLPWSWRIRWLMVFNLCFKELC
jgi:hypothetical protein